MKWLAAACLLLAVIDFNYLQTGVRANEICCGGDDRRKTSPNDPPYKSVTIPVKVHCEAPKQPKPSLEETRIVNEVREKQKLRKSAAVEVERKAAAAVTATATAKEEETTAAVAAKPGKSRSSAMAAECQQCEIQIKANGDGIFLRCRKCHATDADGFRFPTNPNRVLQLP